MFFGLFVWNAMTNVMMISFASIFVVRKMKENKRRRDG